MNRENSPWAIAFVPLNIIFSSSGDSRVTPDSSLMVPIVDQTMHRTTGARDFYLTSTCIPFASACCKTGAGEVEAEITDGDAPSANKAKSKANQRRLMWK